MARYVGPSCKLCRREGLKLLLKGDRCLSSKCAVERRSGPPGSKERRRRFRGRTSEYGIQLREKQKVRRVYGVLERQFRRYYREAGRRKGLTGSNLLTILESRLDNVVYRLGFADSRQQARQLVQHGHFDLGGVRTNISSCLVKPGDEIAVRERSRRLPYFRTMVERLGERAVPEWLSLDAESLRGQVVSLPSREHVDIPVNDQLVVEYYSR